MPTIECDFLCQEENISNEERIILRQELNVPDETKEKEEASKYF